MKFSIASCYFL